MTTKMPEYFDYDNGNGAYDVATRDDHERWADQKRKELVRKRYEETTGAELAGPLFEVPY